MSFNYEKDEQDRKIINNILQKDYTKGHKMKHRVYKFIELGDQDTRYEIFESMVVLNEKQLRNKFDMLKRIGSISQKELDDYKVDPDYDIDKDVLDIGTIIDMINDICNYNAEHYYLVAEMDIEL